MKPLTSASLLLASALVAFAPPTTAAEPAPAPAPAPTPTAPPPSVRQILDRYVESTGGRAALEKLRTRVMKGVIEVTSLGASGPFVVRAKAPNLQVSTIEFGGFGSIREGFDGKSAWSSAPLQGTRRKTGSELARVQRNTVFPRELHLAQAYESLTNRGPARVGTNETWIVEATPKDGAPDRLYFDQHSGLLLREESKVSTIAGDLTFQIDLSDYRVVDGVKVPFSMKVPQPADMGFQVRFEDVKHNVDVPDAEFAEPKE